MKAAPFDYCRPASLEEALAAFQAHGGEARYISGGQSLVPMMAFRLAQPSLLIDLAKITELSGFSVDADGLHLGGGLRWRELLESAEIAAAHPLLHAAIGHVAHPQIRSRGTVGGSLAHADPAAELPCVAVTCGAEIETSGPGGRRRMSAEGFFQGALHTCLEDAELIVRLHLPPWPRDTRWAFREFSRRRGDFAICAIAAMFTVGDSSPADVRIGAIGAADRPIRLAEAESMVLAAPRNAAALRDLAEAATAGLEPPEDVHADAGYRRALLAHLLEEALAEMMSPSPGG